MGRYLNITMKVSISIFCRTILKLRIMLVSYLKGPVVSKPYAIPLAPPYVVTYPPTTLREPQRSLSITSSLHKTRDPLNSYFDVHLSQDLAC